MTLHLMIGFIAGLCAGTSLGCLIMGLCIAAKRGEE